MGHAIELRPADPSLHVLVLDDDTEVAHCHARMAHELGHRATVLTDPAGLHTHLDAPGSIDWVLLDLGLGADDGLDVLRRIRLLRPEVRIVVVTVLDKAEPAIRALRLGAWHYLLKPLRRETLAEMLSHGGATPAAELGERDFASLLTGCAAMREAFKRVRAFAKADVTVLLQGESGTGKELIAERLHALSDRRDERFLAVNVSALTPTLFESELFGHRRGSFTGALRDHQGYLEAAGAGTLFLDEIGELGQDEQKKLLRVLQTRRFSPIGTTEEHELRARVVLATNRNLSEEVAEGRFRADLYYRLCAYAVQLPPLRDRPGDVDLLAAYFLHKYSGQFRRSLVGFDAETLRLLRAYHYPGNVRELEGIVSGAVLLAEDDRIRPDALPHHVRYPAPPGDDLEAARHRAIVQALAECGGHHGKAADRLGIHRSTLTRILKKFRGSAPPDGE